LVGNNIIPFNIPYITGHEQGYVVEAIQRKNLAGDGPFTKKCQLFLEEFTRASSVLLTSSCTHALELSALLCNIQPGDEVIMASFTFVSSANAFILRGAKIIFVDIRPDTMNIDEQKIKAAITSKTKIILVMHYAGVSCEMDKIMALANKHNIFVVEDAAQCIDAYYDRKHLGTIGHLGALSFHSTKNIHCGEGGALLINDKSFVERAEIIREKGTNRKAFLRGQIDKYSWVNIGSSYLMSELNAAFLFGQLQELEKITHQRKLIWSFYQEAFGREDHQFELAIPPDLTKHNGHIFYLKCKSNVVRSKLISYLKEKGISSVFHYVPLHSSSFGKLNSSFIGEDVYTTFDSDRLVRLPLYPGLSIEKAKFIVDIINLF